MAKNTVGPDYFNPTLASGPVPVPSKNKTRVNIKDWERQQLARHLSLADSYSSGSDVQNPEQWYSDLFFSNRNSGNFGEGGPAPEWWQEPNMLMFGGSAMGGEGGVGPGAMLSNLLGSRIGPGQSDPRTLLDQHIANVGGYSAIGYDPNAALADLQKRFPGYFIPDAEGNMWVYDEPSGSFFDDVMQIAEPFMKTVGAGMGFNGLMGGIAGLGASANPLAAGADLFSGGFGAFDPGASGLFGNSFDMGGGFDPGGSGLFGMGGGSSGGGGSILDFFSGDAFNGVKSMITNGEWDWMGLGIPGLNMGDILKGGLNFLINDYQREQAQKNMDRILKEGNPLNDPRRSPYQRMSQELLQNPEQYLSNNPFALALSNHFKNNVIPQQVAVTGNPNLVLDRAGSQFTQAIAGNYNELANILMGYGGFNQPRQGFNSAAQFGNSALQSGAESFRSFGDIADKVFGTPQNPRQQSQNPVTGSTTLFQ